MQHGMKWNGENVSRWIVTEKFNGCRAYWDGAEMWTRGGIKIDLPASWRAELPAGIELDGEVYCGPSGDRIATDAVCYGRFPNDAVFMVFDVPSLGGELYSTRIEYVRRILCGEKIKAVEWGFVMSSDEALRMMRSIQSRGGEGLVVRENEEPYESGRSKKILKFKTEQAKDSFSSRDVDELLAALK